MRQQQRIPIIMNFFKENDEAFVKFLGITKQEVEKLYESWEDIQEEWEFYTDYRLGQLLINMGIIPDGRAWFEEEIDWLVENGYFKFEELHFWGNSYDKDMNRLPETKWIALKDLTTDHIKGIIKYFEGKNLNEKYLEYFNKRIKDENN